MNKRILKRGFAIILVLSMAVLTVYYRGSFNLVAYGNTADEIEKAKEEQAKIDSQIDVISGEIEDLKKQSQDAQSYITELDAKLTSLGASLNELNNRIDDKQEEISRAEDDLEKAETDADDQYEAMKLRIKFMYERNTDTYISMLLSATSLADLLNKANYIEDLSQYDREKLDEYNETITFITNVKNQLVADHEELSDMRISLEAQKASIEVVQREKEDELIALNEMKASAENTKESLEADRVERENELLELIARKNREDEEIRRAAEEASRAAAEAASREAENASNSSGSSGGTENTVGTPDIKPSSGFIWPTDSKRITSYFGETEGRVTPHRGLDIGAKSPGVWGDPIYASAAGVVLYTGYDSSFGNHIIIDHGNGIETIYMHCQTLLASGGQVVNQGQKIALMGSTGNSTGAHLHIAFVVNGTYVNPLNYLSR